MDWAKLYKQAVELFPPNDHCEEVMNLQGLLSVEEAAAHLLHHHYPLAVPLKPGGEDKVSKSWTCGGPLRHPLIEGPSRSYRIMLIGKMPGRSEDDFGRAYTGPSAALLNEICAEVGLDSSEVYATNVLRFVPPDGGTTVKSHWAEICRPLLAREIALVRPDVIMLLGADAVTHFFGRGWSLESVRSQVLPFVDFSTFGKSLPTVMTDGCIKVLATINPAQVLRESGLRDGLTADFRQLRVLLGGAAQPEPEVKPSGNLYEYVYDPDVLKKIVDELLEADVRELGLDCEWGGRVHDRAGKLRTVQFSWAERQAVVAVLHSADNLPTNAPRMLWELRRLFTKPNLTIIGHNIRADALWMDAVGMPIMDKPFFDTMLADHILNENAEHGLEHCVVRYTDMGRYDVPLARWLKANHYNREKIAEVGYLDIPDDILNPYAAADADAVVRLAKVYRVRLAEPKNAGPARCYYNVVLPAATAIHEIEKNGLLVDRQRLVDLTALYGAARAELLAKVVEAVELHVNKCCSDPMRLTALLSQPFNPRSPMQLVRLLFDPTHMGGLGLMPVKTTEKPPRMWYRVERLSEEERSRLTPSTDLETLEALEKQSPLIGLIRDFKILDQVTKNFLCPPESYTSTGEGLYKAGLLGATQDDGRVHTSISQMSETGRHKSSRPNMQNLPKAQEASMQKLVPGAVDIRSGFIADPDCVLVEADFSAAEIWTLAYLSNDAQLIKDAASDLHSRGVVNFFDKPKWPGFDAGKKPPVDWKKEYDVFRTASKTINFGIAYQRGAEAVAREIVAVTGGKVTPTREQAQRYIDTFYDRYTGAEAYVEFCKRCVKTPGWIENPFGRRRRACPSEEADFIAAQEREFVNCPIQGTVADAFNMALYNLLTWRRLHPGKARYKLLLPIHDAILLLVRGPDVPVVIHETIPDCMTHGVTIPSWSPDPKYPATQPFSLDCSIDFGLRWGEKYSAKDSGKEEREALRARGVPEELLEKWGAK